MKGNERKRERTERKRKERNESETFHYKAMTKQTHKQQRLGLDDQTDSQVTSHAISCISLPNRLPQQRMESLNLR